MFVININDNHMFLMWVTYVFFSYTVANDDSIDIIALKIYLHLNASDLKKKKASNMHKMVF